MNKKILVLLSLILVIDFNGYAQIKNNLPALPRSAKTLTEFVPEGWQLVKLVEGNLNEDDQKDTILILQRRNDFKDPMQMFHDQSLLLILFKHQDYWELSFESSKILLDPSFARIFTNLPLNDHPLVIKNRVIALTQFWYLDGNSYIKFVHQFQYQESNWVLIDTFIHADNLKVVSQDATTGFTINTNYLTGIEVHKECTWRRKCSAKEVKILLKPPPLIQFNIMDFLAGWC